jgi:voltage-gated potassium channel
MALRQRAADDEPRIAAWERRLDWPLTALAVVFLAAYAWQVLDTGLGPAAVDRLEGVLTAIWIVFGVDYLVRLWLARRKWRFVGTHVIDLAVLLLPMLRQLRALRVITVISVLNRQLRDDFRGRVAVYVVGTVALVGFVSALAVLDAERDAPDSSITSFGDSLWWTITTISTVGYGDRYPVTTEGRIVAATLMVTGVALLGVVTASIATWFVENLRASSAGIAEEISDEIEEELAETERDLSASIGSDITDAQERLGAQLAAVLAELRAISARLDALEDGSGTRNGPLGGRADAANGPLGSRADAANGPSGR